MTDAGARLAALACLALACLGLVGCSAGSRAPHRPLTTAHATTPAPAHGSSTTGPATTPTPASNGSATGLPATPDPPTATALRRIAQAFNDAYDQGAFGRVYDRWDARSQALLSRRDYIRRHLLCAPATHQVALVEGATKVAGQDWQVRYELGGVQLVDTWYYRHRRWVFDIIASNPDAARLYAMPFRRYAAAVGCSVH